MRVLKYLFLFAFLANNGWAQPLKEIYCGTDTCTSNFTPVDNFDKIFFSSFDLGNENREEYITVKVEDNETPRALRIYADSKSREFPASLDLNLSPNVNGYNAADAVILGDYFDNLNINLDGYSPVVGRSSSQICADYTKRGLYGELAKLEFETVRAIDEQEGGNLPQDRCVFSDVQQIQKNAFDKFSCGGDSDYRVLNSTEPVVTARRVRGKTKCLGVSFQDVCLAPMVEVNCNWRLRYASTKSPIDVLAYGDNRGELADALTPYNPPTLAQIFSTWTRFDGGSYYHPAGTRPYGYSQAGAWVYGSGVVRDTVNSYNYIGFVSAERFDKYDHSVTLSSRNADDDSIGVIIAFTRVNNKNHFLLVSRDTGGVYGSNNNWNLIYVSGDGSREGSYKVNRSNRKVLISKKISTVYRGYGWKGRSTRVKIQRDEDIIRAWTGNWGSGSVRSDSLIQINLNDYPELLKFKGKRAYGYAAWSQNDSTYSNISFKGGLRSTTIVDTVDDKIYEYDQAQAKYVLVDSQALIDRINNTGTSLGDVVITDGEVYNVAAGSVTVFDNLTIEEGGILNIEDGGLTLTEIIVRGNLVHNGEIRGKASFVGGETIRTANSTGKQYNLIISQSAGGDSRLREPSVGEFKTSSNAVVEDDGNKFYWEGNLVGESDEDILYDGNLIYYKGGYSFDSGGLKYYGIYRETVTASVDGVGAGINGGSRGKHGHSLLLVSLGNIEGTGLIDLAGEAGEDGGSVSGGGAGGAGGKLYMEYLGELSEDLEINLNGGTGGAAGETVLGVSGNSGEFGITGIDRASKVKTGISDIYGTEVELVNPQNGKKYWVNADGTVEDSKVGQYSSNDSEAESKKFLMLESEYLDKKERGLLNYMCNNLTYELEEEIELEPNLVTNSNLTNDISGWNLEGDAEWKNEKIKINSNPIASDLIVRSGENLVLDRCGIDYVYKDVIIEEGAKLTLAPKGNCAYKFIIQNKLVLNGTIEAKNRTSRRTSGSFFDNGLDRTQSFDIVTPEQGLYLEASGIVAGRGRGKIYSPNGRRDSVGRSVSVATFDENYNLTRRWHYDTHGRSYQANDAGRKLKSIANGTLVAVVTWDQPRYGCQYGVSQDPNPGGFGNYWKDNWCAALYNEYGARGDLLNIVGRSYRSAYIWFGRKTADKNGTIFQAARYGQAGVISKTLTPPGRRYLSGMPLYIHAPVISGTGTIDARGGGGMGSGGRIYIRYDYVNSDGITYLVSPQGLGRNGFVDIKQTGKTPDLEKLLQLPAAYQTVATEVGQKYRVTGVFSQEIEGKVGSAGQVNVFSDLARENKIETFDIAPSGFINPAWIDSVPTYHHYKQIGVGGANVYTDRVKSGVARDFGCANADTFSAANYNILTCDGRGRGCTRFCYLGTCTSSPKTLFDSYIRSGTNQQYLSYKKITGDLRRGCRGRYVYAISISYRDYRSSALPLKDFRLVNKEEERSAVNCTPPFVGANNNPISTTPSPHFRVEVSTCPTELAAGEECEVTVRSKPQSPGNHTGYLKMICDDPEYGKKSTLNTEMQVSTYSSYTVKNAPLRNSYPVEPKPQYTDLEGSADNVYPYFRSCNDLFKNGNKLVSGTFFIDPDGELGPIDPFPVYCDMEQDGGGWTLASKIATNNDIWSYASPYWTNDETYNETDISLDRNTNMKNKAFTNIKASEIKICLINNENCLTMRRGLNSLKDYFSNAQYYSNSGYGRFDILALTQQNFSNWDNQLYCNKRGFNVENRANWNTSCRFGLIMNNENNCGSPDSMVGLGCYTGKGDLNVAAGATRYSPERTYTYRAFIYVRDDVSAGDKKIAVNVREPIDFVFQAESTTSLIELRAFQREYSAYFDNLEVRLVPSNSGPSVPPAQDGLANVQGEDGPGYYDLFGEPVVTRTFPTYDPKTFKTPDESDWGMRYVTVGQQCPLYYEKIEEEYVSSHIEYDEDDDKCDDIEYKYDPEKKLIDWKPLGFERLAEFGFENINCAIGDCPVKSNVENIDANIEPTISLEQDLRGTQQGEGIVFIYDANNINATASKGRSAITGVNDLPSLNEIRYCYKIQDALSEGENSDFAKDPVVQFRRYNWQAIKVEQSGAGNEEIEDNGKKINLFKKIDSSVRYFLKEELL